VQIPETAEGSSYFCQHNVLFSCKHREQAEWKNDTLRSVGVCQLQ